jgi:glycosyltransferase involved in cell wall biosynthesis
MNHLHPVKILTDISIPQSPLWQRRTENIRHKSNLGFLKIRNNSLSLGLLIFLNRKKYDVIVTANLKTGFMLGLLQYLFRRKITKHIFLEMMLDQEKPTFPWRLKLFFQRKAFSRLNCIFVSSRAETETYSRRLKIETGRFQFLPFHTNVLNPALSKDEGDYVLSAGRTERDYSTLVQAMEGLHLNLIIVADKNSLRSIKQSSSVKIILDLPYEEYIKLLKKAKIVVIPLNPVVKSTGQVVMLEAMSFGKPVIITRTTGSLDYIRDGENGLLVNPEDVQDLRYKIIWLLKNPEKADEIGRKGFLFVKENLSLEKYVMQVLEKACSLRS